MRRKIVLWGANEKDEKLLVALELLEKDNLVMIYTFPEEVATEAFYKAMSEEWKDDKEVEFPAQYEKIERKLSVSDSLLPENIKVDRPDIITRAQAEWHFVVLSSKLYNLYKSEIEELKDKVESLSTYDNAIWEELRSFWTKVQNQVNEKNLFREHGAALRERTNALFDKLKELKKELENEFEKQSQSYVDEFKKEIEEIEEKIEKGLGLAPLFEDLKKIQNKFKDFKFTKEHRNEVWDKIDATFKTLKEKRSAGGSQAAASAYGRLEARYNGLIAAISKMEKSVQLDQKDLDFQKKKVEDSDGQLESQLRQAKIYMIEERITSKQEKLRDMYKTKEELERKLEKEKKKLAKNERMEKVNEAKEIVKQKIAAGISETAKEMSKISEKLEKAASEMLSKKPAESKEDQNHDAAKHIEDEKEGLLDSIIDKVEDLVEDAVDGAKAVIEVIGDEIEEVMDNIRKKEADAEEE